MLENVELVIFDCDGVLVDSESLMAEVFVDIAAGAGLTVRPSDACERFRGRKVSECLAEIEKDAQQPLPPNVEHLFRTRSRDMFRSRLKPIQGVQNLLARIPVPYCVASSSPRDEIQLALRLTGLSPWFPNEHIFSAYEVGFWKPDPGLFRHAANTFGVHPSKCLVVEDSDVGVAGATSAGMPVLHYGRPPNRPPASPFIIPFSSMDDLFQPNRSTLNT